MVNFPAALSSFVGRDDELAQIATLLSNPACRLLTLVGPGGIGKTRLALEAARQFPGAQFVPLQPLTSPDFMVSAMADALSFQFYSGADPKQQLLDYLREKSWLLVLDNFEHLLEGTTLLSEILVAAPAMGLLVTSRERLNLVEEWVLDVGGLAYPTREADPALEQYSAVKLFVQHVQRVNASFRLNEAHRPAVVRICRLVDGMPLGVELAASWVRALSCEAIADEIGRSLDILETPARNVEPRHRTMRAAFAPTWNWLSEDEQAVFMKLSVFRGGFTREAAEQVAGTSLRTLSSLVDKSLLRIDANGRYDLHELLRQFGAEKLLDAGEVDTIIQEHLDYFLKFVEQVEAHNFGRDQILWYDRVEIEMDNLRVTLARSLETETGLRVAAALGWFFSERCHWSEGLRWLEQSIDANPDAPVSLRSKALHSAGALAGHLDDHQRAWALCEQALILARASNDRWNIAWSLSQMGVHAARNIDQEIPLLEESLALFRELEDAMGLCHNLIRRSFSANHQRDYVYVRTLMAEASLLANEADDTICIAWVAFLKGQIAWLPDHDLRQARTYLETSLSLFRQARFRWGVANLLSLLAQVEQAMEHYTNAEMFYQEALLLHREWVIYNETVEDTLVGLAGIAKLNGQLERAAKLLGASESAIESYHTTVFPILDNFRRDVVEVRAQLGEAAFSPAWIAGKALTRAQAIAYALEDSPKTIEMVATHDAGLETIPSELLSNRELEILRLMADGLSNGEIAQQLVLATSTIKWYVRQIFSKLDVTNRTQAVTRAQGRGLLS